MKEEDDTRRVYAGFLAMLLFAGAGGAHLFGHPGAIWLAVAAIALAIFFAALLVDDGPWRGPLAGR